MGRFGRSEVGIPAGSFMTLLIDAAIHADSINTEKLRLGFPEVVAAVRGYQAHENDILKRANLSEDE
jgi:hypothetical protein